MGNKQSGNAAPYASHDFQIVSLTVCFGNIIYCRNKNQMDLKIIMRVSKVFICIRPRTGCI